MESRSFPSGFDIKGRYAKHLEKYYLRYGEQGSNDVDNSLWTSFQKKDKLVVKPIHKKLFMRLVYMN